MTNKKETIKQLKSLLASGDISKDEVRRLIEADTERESSSAQIEKDSSVPKRRVAATDIMFIIGGVILFAAFQVMIAQTLENMSAKMTTESSLFGAILALMVAVALWATTLIGGKREAANSSVAKGFRLSFVVAGSLLFVAAAAYGAVTFTLYRGVYGSAITSDAYYMFGLCMLLVAVVHGLFSLLTKRPIVAGAGVLGFVVGVTSLLLGAVDGIKAPGDVYALIFIAAGVLLCGATRAVHRATPKLLGADTFDVLGQIVALTAMTVGLSGERDMLWRLVLIASTLGLFYLSISKRSQSTLAIAAFFLTLTIISTAFKYFSGMGTASVLLVSAVAVLGVATAAVVIRQKYMSDAVK